MRDDFVWKDPPAPRRPRNHNADTFASWTKEARSRLARQPGRTAQIRTFRSPTRAWGAVATIHERGLMPGVELRAVKTDEGSAIYGTFIHPRLERS